MSSARAHNLEKRDQDRQVASAAAAPLPAAMSRTRAATLSKNASSCRGTFFPPSQKSAISAQRENLTSYLNAKEWEKCRVFSFEVATSRWYVQTTGMQEDRRTSVLSTLSVLGQTPEKVRADSRQPRTESVSSNKLHEETLLRWQTAL